MSTELFKETLCKMLFLFLPFPSIPHSHLIHRIQSASFWLNQSPASQRKTDLFVFRERERESKVGLRGRDRSWEAWVKTYVNASSLNLTNTQPCSLTLLQYVYSHTPGHFLFFCLLMSLSSSWLSFHPADLTRTDKNESIFFHTFLYGGPKV